MANALFDKGREGFLAAEIDWDANDIRCCLVRGYTFNAAHDYRDDITGAGKTTTGGVADANDVTFTAVAAGAAITSIIIYTEGSSTDATRRLIAYIDTGTGLPVTPDGTDIVVSWSSGSDKIFKL
jgi:hypothetical protein